VNQIDQIKEILFSNEKRALDALTRRIEKRESRVADMADVLPESLGRSHADGDRLNKALRIPVEECLKDSISRDPQTFADALFPVMGPAIRKSISETLKAFTESINQAIEEKTSIRSFKWRMQAKKAGIPYAQYLLQKNLEYRVDHAYLIQPHTGLLISDAHRPDAIRKDDEAVSAMLTAIQDFVQESFSSEKEGTLETADIGQYALWTMQGPHAMLACVINGVPPRGLRENFMEVLERIHLQYGEVLEAYDGSQIDKVKAIEPQLEDCLLEQAKELAEVKPMKKTIGPIGILGLVLLGLLAWLAWQSFQLKQQGNDLLNSLDLEPGIFVTSSEYSKGKISIKGLRDSAAPLPLDMALAQGLNEDRVNLDFVPFHSLEKPIVESRLRQILSLPEGVEMRLSNTGELSFSGEITPDFKLDTETRLQGMLGINSLAFGDIKYSDDVLLNSALTVLSPPESVDLSVLNGVLSLQGVAPYQWQSGLDEQRKQIDGLKGLDSAGIVIAELGEIKNIEAQVNNQAVEFVWRTRLQDFEEANIVSLGKNLKSYGQLLENLEIEPEIILTGFTDNTGSEEQNRNLQMERALYIKGRLVGQGVRSNWIFVRSGSMLGAAKQANPADRKVVITLNADLSAFN
jgi:OOP family OmpA-OmpF porin